MEQTLAGSERASDEVTESISMCTNPNRNQSTVQQKSLTESTNKITIALAIARIVLSIIMLMAFFPDGKSCFSRGVAFSCDVMTNATTQDEVPVCAADPCIIGGCDIKAYKNDSRTESVTKLHKDTCYYEGQYSHITDSGCSVEITHYCLCWYWIIAFITVVGYAGMQAMFTFYLLSKKLTPHSNLYNAVYFGAIAGESNVSFLKWATHPLFVAMAAVDWIFVLCIHFVSLFSRALGLTGAMLCELRPASGDYYYLSNDIMPPPVRRFNVVFFLAPVVVMLLFEWFKMNIFICLQQQITRNENTSFRQILYPLCRLDKTLRYVFVTMFQSILLGVYIFAPWVLILYVPINNDYVKPATSIVPAMQSLSQANSPFHVASSSQRASRDQPSARESEDSRQWRKKFRTSVLVSLLKTLAAIALLVIIEPEWRVCFKSFNATASSCTVSTTNYKKTVYCTAYCMFDDGCDVSGVTVLPHSQDTENEWECDYYGRLSDNALYAECTASVTNECACHWWLIVTGSIVVLNVLYFFIQVGFSMCGHFDPQKDVFNIIYGSHSLSKHWRFVLLARNCFLAFMEVFYLGLVVVIFVFFREDGGYKPVCTVSDTPDSLHKRFTTHSFLRLFGNCLLFAVKESYKINVYMSIQKYREGEGWKHVLAPLFRIDVTVKHFGVMALQTYVFCSYALVACMCGFGAKHRVDIAPPDFAKRTVEEVESDVLSL